MYLIAGESLYARSSPNTANPADKLQPGFSCRSGEHIAAVSQSVHSSRDGMRQYEP